MDRVLIDDDEEWSMEEINSRIINAFTNAAKTHIPKSKEKIDRENNFPNHKVQVLKGINYWGKQFRRFRIQATAERYTEFELLANELIKENKLKQWNEFLKRQGKHPLSSIPFWGQINRLRESKRHKNIDNITVDGRNYTKMQEKGDLFANSLEEKFKLDDNQNFNNSKKEEKEKFFSELPFENRFSIEQKKIPELSMNELILAIKKAKNKTSTDHYGMSNKILKHLGDLAKIRILALFNKCLRENKIPNGWKSSVVTMLLKSGQDTNMLSSYTRISMTPSLPRLFERLILVRLQQHLKRKNILIKSQSGIRESRQSRDNLFTLIQGPQQGFNIGKKTAAIFFDIVADFDKVLHLGLVYKLYKIGTPYYLIAII